MGAPSRDCPEGLVPVPTTDPEFCVQPYEAFVEDDGTASSQQGATPDIHVSFVEAQEACRNTIIDGQPMRLINHQEWKQAGGHRPYPWGDAYAANKCVLDSPETHGQWATVQPSGSMPDCVSEYGVYDQIGNAWEWVDIQQTATRAAWLKMVQEHGYDVTVKQTLIEADEGLLSKLQYRAVCVNMKGLAIDQHLIVVDLNAPIADDCVTAGQGYLWFNDTDASQGTEIPKPGSLLPVELWGKRVVWDKSRDGEAVGAKVGGSFYSGGESTLHSFWVGHLPTFGGSIGFRCSY